MTSPWNLPTEPVPPSRRDRCAAPEPFCVAFEMAAVDLFLSEALLPMLGQRIPVDGRLGQRGVGDIVEATVAARIVQAAEGREHLKAFPPGSNRSMEDVKITAGRACVHLDVKTRNLGREFSMPNIVSIRRLERFYRKGTNVFVVLTADYRDHGCFISVEDVRWHRVEEICWSCLSIQNLGQGQLQLTDARRPIRLFDGDRQAWMKVFHAEGAAFYGRLAERASAAWNEWIDKATRTDS